MTKVRSIARHILMWSYERGTLQYDIICALILAFIFFVPPSCFFAKKSDDPQSLNHRSTQVQSSAEDQHRGNAANDEQ
jgi:hypothetical protein